jgi:prepilin-type N-terminal cleavage/methylation domain-containing protein
MTAQTFRTTKGFTLIELLVVIGILAILLAITLIAINPARQFGQANDTKRRSAVTQILNSIGAYTADSSSTGGKGVLPVEITLVDQEISEAGADLCATLVPNYIPALPRDPSLAGSDQEAACAAGYTTGYHIIRDANGRVTVSAPAAYEAAITVTR